MPVDRASDDDPLTALERCRPALHALDGVVATGIGRRADGVLCVQIFVVTGEQVANVNAAAGTILGAAPFEVVVTGEPVAGRGQEGH